MRTPGCPRAYCPVPRRSPGCPPGRRRAAARSRATTARRDGSRRPAARGAGRVKRRHSDPPHGENPRPSLAFGEGTGDTRPRLHLGCVDRPPDRLTRGKAVLLVDEDAKPGRPTTARPGADRRAPVPGRVRGRAGGFRRQPCRKLRWRDEPGVHPRRAPSDRRAHGHSACFPERVAVGPRPEHQGPSLLGLRARHGGRGRRSAVRLQPLRLPLLHVRQVRHRARGAVREEDGPNARQPGLPLHPGHGQPASIRRASGS